MSALLRLGRFVGLALVALIVVAAATTAVRVATAPPSPGLPAGFTVDPDSTVARPTLRAELLRRFALDQAVRESSELGAVSDLASPGGVWAFAGEAVRMERVDRPNRRRVRELVADGWPGAADIGTDGLEALFYLVQHADLELQREALAPFRAAWRAGDLDGGALALLTDRVRMNEGEPQLYGSQFRVTPAEGMVLHPIEAPESVDARRAEMGMEPLADYLDVACQEMEICVELPS